MSTFGARLLAASSCLLASVAWGGGGRGISPFTAEEGLRGIDYLMPPTGGFYGYGCGFADFDADGDADIVLLGRLDGVVGIFENVGGTFVDHSAASGIPPLDSLSAFATADYDGDGDMDLFLSRLLKPGLLFRNEGGFHFSDATIQSGIASSRLAKGVAWGDYDGDGWVDLYVCNYVYFSLNSRNQLWRNNGDGTFEDRAPQLQLDDAGASLEAVWTDFDRDGDLDLYLGNDRATQPGSPPNRLFRNEGDGTFSEVGASTGADVALCCMGIACGDFNGDLRSDFLLTNTTQAAPPLFGAFPFLLSTENGTFVQAQEAWGIAHPTSTWGWGASFLDWNNDGLLDLYVNDQFDANALLQNNGKPPLVDVALAAGIGGGTTSSYCAAHADVDLDGDLDILLNNLGEPVRLFINHEGEKRNWLALRVVGEWPNTAAIGANAEVSAGGSTQFREILAGGNSYLGQNEQVVQVGLAKAETASAIVRWPSNGPTRTVTNIPANQRWTIYPPSRLGDADGDGDADVIDRLAMCGAVGAVAAGAEVFDFDGDFIVASADRAAFQTRYEAEGRRWADLDGDGTVSGGDLAVLLGAWSSTDCLADLDGDEIVAGGDLAVMLGAWGQ